MAKKSKGKKKKQKRGYLVSLLISFDSFHAFVWRIYSELPKIAQTIKFQKKWKNTDKKARYQTCEQIINLIRPIIRNESVKSVLLCHSPDSDIGKVVLTHITKHHQWILNSNQKPPLQFREISGVATDLEQVQLLLETKIFQEEQEKATSAEGDSLLDLLDHAVSSDDNMVLFGVKEIEEQVLKGGKKDKSVSKILDYLLVNNEFLENHTQKNRLQRLMQIAENKGLKVRILDDESPAGSKVNDLSGLVSFKIVKKNRNVTKED